jgi:hypothetical protein
MFYANLLFLVMFLGTSAAPVVVFEKASRIPVRAGEGGGLVASDEGGLKEESVRESLASTLDADTGLGELVGEEEGVQLGGAGLVGGQVPSEPLVSVEVYRDGDTAFVNRKHLDSGEVVYMPSLDESELLTSDGPFNIIRVVDFLATIVQEQVLDSYYGNGAACSLACGKETGLVDVTSCLSCISVSKAHLKPFPVTTI